MGVLGIKNHPKNYLGKSQNHKRPNLLFRLPLAFEKPRNYFLSIIHENHAFRIKDALDNDIHFFQRKWLV